ncbi:MAG: OmpH family outer membrane protein [Bacteroidota bacterium]
MAQQKVGYIDSDFILKNLPDYATVQQNLDRMAQEWQREMETMEGNIESAFREYQARELLYTKEERDRKREDIMRLEDELEQFRLRHFGPEGELFKQQSTLMGPIQERILAAVQEVAVQENYDYVFDKAGDYLFVYFRDQYDVSILVLEELGIDPERIQGASTAAN